ncbi:MAG: T9SS type A sorting domain-containing protein [Saprospiraceae bacterium]|nr:T9SS type A sorting domain-containing protein [Saprospiraceae bacterium]
MLTETCWGRFIEHPLNTEVLLSNDPDRCAEWSFTQQRHIGSTILTFNYDGDEDYDVLLGDVGSNSVNFIKNGGDKNNAWGTYVEENFPQDDTPVDLDAFIGIFHLDADNDGKKDLIFAPNSFATNVKPYPQNVNNIHFYKNTGYESNPKYELIETDFLAKSMIDLGGRVYPVFIDIDKDSLKDLIIGTGPVVDHDTILPSRMLFFRNSGTRTIPKFALADDDFLNFSEISKNHELNYLTPAFGDLDDDGDMDIIVGNQDGTLIFRENISASNSGIKYGEPVYNYQNINIFSFSAPFIADINKDGLNDLLVGCGEDYNTPLQYYGSVVYFQNKGSNSNPVFDSDPFSFPNTPEFGNLRLSSPYVNKSNAYLSIYRDADDEYLFAGHYYGGISVYSNISENIYGTLPMISKDYGNINMGSNSAPAIADIDGDGYLEMLIGTPRGGFEFWNTEIKVTTGVKVNEIEEDIKIYPNPGQSFIYLDIEDISDKTIKAVIYDLMGGKISEHNISSGNNKINIEKLTIGTYLLKIQLNKKTLNFKIIKSTF